MLAAWARDRTKFREIERRVSDYLPTVLEQARQEAPEAIAMLRRFEDLWGNCQGPSPASFDRADDCGHRAVRRSRERLRGRLGSGRSEEHTSELQSLMRISYAVFCLKKTNRQHNH